MALMLLCALALSACGAKNDPAAATAAPAPGTPEVVVTLPVSHTPPPSDVQTDTEVPFDGPLSVIIRQPADGSTVSASTVVVRGSADPGTVVTIQETILLVGAEGQFQAEVNLEPGINLIEITASDAQENQDFAYLTVLYDP